VDENLARAGIFHPVEPDVASALTIRMYKVVSPLPHTIFAESDTDWGHRPACTARRATLVPRLRVLLSVNKCDSLGIRIFDVFRFGELFRELVKRNL
jgi:hypothetical protein